MDALNAALAPVVTWVREEPGIALCALLIVHLLTLGLGSVALFRLGALRRKQARLLRGTDGLSLERMLLEYADEATQTRERIETAQRAGLANAEAIARCLQRVGIVRYDAFPDVGGRQSFSIALLDCSRSGVVLTGLHSRHSMRLYAKPVVQGQGAGALSDEERQAIASAAEPNSLPLETRG